MLLFLPIYGNNGGNTLKNIYQRLELMIIYAAVRLDNYYYSYDYSGYLHKIGAEEVHRIRNINNLIHEIADNSSGYCRLVKSLHEDMEYLSAEMAEDPDPQTFSQLKELNGILCVLSSINM